ncbi:MAG: filamentous hemagglutinin N-terminal domain-containing protein [Candidatus Thermoplasmatota archaeon]|nr:filamentous hemagglutinin N-terminal domain-containing protein [Candidatus Thermoplasmatota archaeon]
MRNRVEPSACVAKGSRFRIKPVVAALCSALAVSAIAHAPAWSAPTGGAVAQGEGAIGTPDAQTVQVTQTSDKLIVNWQGFSLAADELARFVQPSRDAVALNRVTGADPSVILGRLSANGQVFLVNPNGVVFGRSAVVDVASLVASTLNITDDDFMNGRYLFLASEGDAGVLNQGTIRAADGGYIVLIGNQAQNEGVLAARLGTVALGAGKQATLDLAGDGLLRFAVDGEALGAKVANKGLIQADGGRVLLSARAARDLLATVVSNEGVIEARSLVNRGGVIRLEASDPLDAAAMGTGVASVQNAAGDVINTGRLDVSAAERGAARGLAVMTGARVGHAGEIRADGADGTAAGKVYLNASQKTLLASGSAIRADGRGAQSNGGEIRVLSDLKTGTTVVREAAQLSARGGEVSGDGGFIEVSGANFALHGDISVGATDGRAGTFLLDPTDILIVNPKADMPEKGADYNDSGDANAKKLPDGGGNSLLFGTANFDAGGGDELTEDNDSTATDNNDTVSNEIEAAYLVTLDGNVRLQATQDILIGVNDGAPDSALMADAMLLDFANLGAGDSLTLQAGRHITMNAAGSEIKTAGGAIHLEADSPHTGATGAADGTGTLTAGKLTSGGGGITLIGADFALGGAVNAGAGKVAVAPGVDGAAFKLGSPSGAVLTDAEIDLITADTITLGQANSAGADGLLGNSDDKLLTAGDTTIDDVTPAGTTKLRLISSTIVNDADDTGNAVAVANLHLEADAAGTTSTFNIDADTLTGAGSADAGNFNITDSDGLSVADLVNANGAITINTGGATTLTKVETKGGTDTDDITVKASAGDLTVKAVTAASSGDVTLEATAGAILDDEAGANATTVITGDVVTLTAKSGVGTPTTNIDTKAATLDVSVTDAGLIKLSEADGVNLLAIDTANGLIDITTGGDTTATNLASTTDAAGTTSTFNIDADTLTGAGSADAGNFNITDSDGLSVADLVNANGAITINTGGATTLTKVETKGGTDTDDITVKASAGDLTVKAVTAASSGDVTLEATAGAILDDEAGANATTVITGDVVTLTAKSGVGTPTTNIDTKAATLDVSVTDAGLIKLSEADGVNLLAIDTANGLIDITTGGDTTATNLASTTDAAANTVTLTATAGDIDIGTINAKTLGNVTITANSAAGQDLADADDNSAISGATVTLTAKGDIGTGTTKRIETAATTLDVSSTDVGDIYLAEADGVELKAIDTANGLVDITTGGDTVATNLTSTTDAAANTITLTATAGDIEIGTIDAKTLGNVTLTADSAAGQDILDADDNSTISGATVTLTAKGNIGTGATKRIETAATTLDVSSTDVGDIYLAEADGVELKAVDTANGHIDSTAGGNTVATQVVAGGAGKNVTLATTVGDISVDTVTALDDGITLNAAGAITDNNGATNNLSAASANLTAGSAIGTAADALDTTVATLGATANAGGVYIAEADAVTLNAIEAKGAGNDVVVTNAAGDMTVVAVTAADDITLEATAGAILDDEAGTASATAIAGDVVTLTAKSGVGTATTNIDTKAATLDVSVTDAGLIKLAEADGVNLLAIDTANGLIDITTGGDTVATNLTSATDAAANTITLVATAGDVEVGTIDAKTLGNVTLTADSAAGQDILDADDNSAISGATVTLTAKGNIGTGTTKRIETAATTLDVSSTDAGHVYLAEKDGVELKAIDTANGLIDVTTGGETVIRRVAAVGDARLAVQAGDARLDALSGNKVSLTAEESILDINDANGVTRNITAKADTLLKATQGTVGTNTDGIEVDSAGKLSLYAGGEVGLVSGNINGEVLGNVIHPLNTAPGLLLLNGKVVGGGLMDTVNAGRVGTQTQLAYLDDLPVPRPIAFNTARHYPTDSVTEEMAFVPAAPLALPSLWKTLGNGTHLPDGVLNWAPQTTER